MTEYLGVGVYASFVIVYFASPTLNTLLQFIEKVKDEKVSG